MKIRTLYIGHATGNNHTEVGFYRKPYRKPPIERGKWYGQNKPISDASMNRITMLIDNKKIIVSNVFPLPKQLWIVYEPAKAQEYFEITSVAREDLERLGFDVADVDDNTMLRLASKMSDSYTASGEFWAELEYHGEMLDIPRPNPKDIYDDEDDTFENDRRMPDWSISEDDDIQYEPLDKDSDDD